MRERLLAVALGLAFSVGLGGPPPAASPAPETAATAGLSALEAIDAFLAGWPAGSKPTLLGLAGFHAAPRPASWLLLAKDPRDGSLREFVLADGQIDGERAVSPLPGQDLPHLPLPRGGLRIDSDEAIAISSRLAAAAAPSFASVHLHLRVRDEGREPVWLVAFHGEARVPLGQVYLSATSGAILRESWAGEAQPGSAPRQGPGLTQTEAAARRLR